MSREALLDDVEGLASTFQLGFRVQVPILLHLVQAQTAEIQQHLPLLRAHILLKQSKIKKKLNSTKRNKNG